MYVCDVISLGLPCTTQASHPPEVIIVEKTLGRTDSSHYFDGKIGIYLSIYLAHIYHEGSPAILQEEDYRGERSTTSSTAPPAPSGTSKKALARRRTPCCKQKLKNVAAFEANGW